MLIEMGDDGRYSATDIGTVLQVLGEEGNLNAHQDRR